MYCVDRAQAAPRIEVILGWTTPEENRVLKAQVQNQRLRLTDGKGIPPSTERATSWQTFLRAHWGAVAAADFFTTEVWTVHGLVTYYTVFVIELHSRRVSIVGSTPHPDEAFMLQIVRQLTDAGDGVLGGRRFLICDRDRSLARKSVGRNSWTLRGSLDIEHHIKHDSVAASGCIPARRARWLRCRADGHEHGL